MLIASSLYLRGESFIIRWEGAGTFSVRGGRIFFFFFFFFCDLLGRGSEINNSWSRGKGSYNFRHKRRRGSEFSFHKKNPKTSQFLWGEPPNRHCSNIFSFYSFRLRKNLVPLSSPGARVHHILQWLLESFCESLHW